MNTHPLDPRKDLDQLLRDFGDPRITQLVDDYRRLRSRLFDANEMLPMSGVECGLWEHLYAVDASADARVLRRVLRAYRELARRAHLAVITADLSDPMSQDHQDAIADLSRWTAPAMMEGER